MMFNYYEVDVWMQVVIMTVQFLVLCTGVCLIPTSLKGRAILPKILIPLCILISGGMLVSFSSNVRSVKKEMLLPRITKWLSEQPLLFSSLVILAIIAYFVYYIIKVRHRKKQHHHQSLHQGKH